MSVNVDDAAAHEPMSQRAPLRGNRDFALLTTGRTITAVTGGMVGLSYLLLGFAVTHSAAKTALVATFAGLGSLVMELPAGALCDRFNRKRIMIVSALLLAACYGCLCAFEGLGWLTTECLYAFAFIGGCVGDLFAPAEQAALKRIVPQEQLTAAMSVTQARSSLGSVIGPPLAGLLFNLWRGLPFAVHAVGHLVGAAFVAATRTPLPAPDRGARRTGFLADIREGLSYVLRSVGVRDMVLMISLVNFGFTGLITGSIVALQMGGTSASALGILELVSGTCAIAGAMIAPLLSSRTTVGRLVLVGVALMAICGILLVPFPGLVPATILLGAMSLLLMPVSSALLAFLVATVPDDMLGRASSVVNIVGLAVVPLGDALVGILLAHLGRPAALSAFAGVVALGVLCGFIRPSIRNLGAMSPETPTHAPSQTKTAL